jgi:hypothetical protein
MIALVSFSKRLLQGVAGLDPATATALIALVEGFRA